MRQVAPLSPAHPRTRIALPWALWTDLSTMKPTTLLWCAAVVAACANVAPPSAAASARLAVAENLLADDPHSALSITDELLRENPQWRAARLVAASGARQLAQQARGMQPTLLLQDAVANLEVALKEADDQELPDAWRMLADCRFDLGEFAAAGDAARMAARGYRANGTQASRQQAAAAILLSAQCDLRGLVALRNEELQRGEADRRGQVPPGPATARLAQQAVAAFDSVRKEYPAEACNGIALVWIYLGQDRAAADEFERGIRTSPQSAAIHEAYLNRMIELGQQEALAGAYTSFLREQPGVPLLRWYLGRSQFARADQLRAIGNFQGAIAGYQKANGSFGEYAAMVPAHRDDAHQWLALCELSMARTAVDLGDLDGARRHLFAADEASPRAVAYDAGRPALVDSFGSHYTGVVFALNRALAESGVDGVAAALAFNEAVLARHPDRWGFVYNNAALPARDLGVRRWDAGDAAAARELWERSYQYYEKAVALSPDDARIANDCGLMLIYHLDRNFDRARELFERAIAIGLPQLEALPADADARERELLEEAIGDAYQNLAVMMRKHLGKPFADYREYCAAAVRYFPYERRAAAALLRSEGRDDGASPAVTAALQGTAAEALAKIKAQVDAKAAAADYDGALTLLDGIQKTCAEHAPFHALRGELTLKFAVQSRDARRKGVDFLFQDAVDALKKAVSLDGEPIGPRLLLTQALYDTSDFEGASSAASALLLHLQSKGGGKAEEQRSAHMLRANAAARTYTQLKGAGKDAPEQLTAARTSFRALEAQGQLDTAMRGLWSATEQWAGAGAEAVNIFVRALQRAPEDQALMGTLVDTAAQQGQMPLAIAALAARDDATSLWYLGRAHYLHADNLRRSDKWPEAQKALDEAKQQFERSMQKNNSYRDSCEQWVAMCLGKKGNLAFHQEDLANAEKWLLEATRLRPDRIGEDLGLAETTKLGILRVADKHFKKRDLAKTEAIYRAASDAANGDLDLLNNSGLFARDHGNQLERAGKKEEAMGMYEQSYKAYRRAQQLEPGNVRLRNDCALIAIYHLDRDWELAKEMLDGGIATGQQRLRDDPPSDVQQKQDLDEAVGDCYENLALWHLKHSQDFAAAKAAAEASMKHYPGARRGGARRHLQEAERKLQGK